MERKSNRTIFRGLFQRRDSQKVGKAPGARKLRVEGLEERRLLSASDWGDGGEGVFENAAIEALATDEIASAEHCLQRETVEIEALATDGTYDQHDLSVVQALGLTAESEGVVWNSEGRLVELTYANSEITYIEIKGCSALSSLDVSRCANLTSLDCSKNQLTTLNISGCVNLDRLDCSENALSYLDLSQCSNLTILYCYINELSELNVSNCTKLLRIDCFMNNLTQLDVTALVDLSHFECYSNNLTSLDVSNCPQLYFLNCEKNQISSLDVSNIVNLHRLYCSDNHIESLDLTNCIDLNIINCYNNQLSELIVSNCNSLWLLSCGKNKLTEIEIPKSEELTYIGCYNNNLTAIDVSHNTQLQTLYCENNNISELDISLCTKLQNLYCYNNSITELDLSYCKKIQELKCHNNNLNRIAISNCEDLQILECQNNNLIELDLTESQNLETLTCNDNQIESLTLSCRSTLQTLNCRNNCLSSLDLSNFTVLRQLYTKNNPLISLNMSGCTNIIQLSVTEGVLERIDVSNCSKLKWLFCYSNNLEEINISGCTKLDSLNCGFNKLEELIFSDCTNLSSLSCQHNSLTRLDLSSCINLTSLGCSDNNLTYLDLSCCPKINSIDCFNNSLTSINLRYCFELQSIRCYNNQIIEIDLTDVANLVSLVCYDNYLTKLDVSGKTMLGQLICYQNNLTELDVSGCSNLQVLYCHHNNLSELYVTDCANLNYLAAAVNPISNLDLSCNPSLSTVSIERVVSSILLAESTTVKVRVHKQDDIWNELEIRDSSGIPFEISESGEYFNIIITSDRTNPITINYLKNGEVVGTTKINEIVLTPPVIAGSVTNTAIVVKINPVEDAERYVLEYDTDPNFSEPRTKVYSTTGAKTITGLTPGTPYYVRVKAIATNADDSDWSTLRLIPGAATLAAPKLVASATKTALIVNIGAVENAESYVLEYSENPDFSEAIAKTYRTTGAKTFTNLPFGKTYYFRVKATSESCNDSKWSQLAFATGQLSGTTLKVASSNYDRVELTIAKVDKAVGCAIEYSKSADFSDSTLVSFSTFGTKTISGLDENATYYFRAKALGDGTNRVDSAWTSTITRRTAEYLGALSAPSVVALSATKNALVLKFTGVPNGAKYVVEYGTDPTFAGCATKTYPSSGSKTITGLAVGTTYYLRLKAIATGYADSDWIQATATTKGAPASSAILDLDAAFEDYFDDELALI